jgi:hypothetical protein
MPSVARRLAYYVYLYINPLVNPPNGSVFYVGMGRNREVLTHLRAGKTKAMTKMLKAIRAEGEHPRIEILAHGLRKPDDAFKVEAAAIDLLGLKNLVNKVRGHGVKYGRMPLQDVIAHYTLKKAVFKNDPVILIRINQLYRYGMTDAELYDATRGVWRVSPKRDKAKYALAVFEGVVKEVYEIKQWFPAGSTFSTRDRRDIMAPGRWEFVGKIAEDKKVRSRYVNRYVGLLPHGAMYPISYVNIP